MKIDLNNKTLIHYIELSVLIIVILFGMFLRLDHIRYWKAHPQIFFFKSEPLLTTFDGYYYLGLARDLKEGHYTPIDYNRAVPDYPKRPYPPPLLPILAASVSKIFGVSLNWAAVLLPAIVGVLLAIPVFAIGSLFGGSICGLIGSFLCLISFYYFYRSAPGWFDTDFLNVTFTYAVLYCFMMFGLLKDTRRYGYVISGFIFYLLFLWCWDSTPQVVTIISLLPLVIALALFYRPSKKEGTIFYSVLILALIGVFLWKGLGVIDNIVHAIKVIFGYISKEKTNAFPPMGITVSEQVRPTLNEVIAKTTDSLPLFIAGVLGLLLLFYKNLKKSVFLYLPLGLAVLSLLFAKRFLIFMAPIMGIGVGFLCAFIWDRITNPKLAKLIVPVVIVVLSIPGIKNDLNLRLYPRDNPLMIAGMVKAGEVTPKDAVIWAWWDQGYILKYWSRRATISDGTFHGGERAVCNAIPLSTNNFEYAANFMHFYVSRGIKGINMLNRALGGDFAKTFIFIKKVLSNPPKVSKDIIAREHIKPTSRYKTVDDWLKFFYPKKARPVYLFLDSRLTRTAYWWFWIGTWNFKHFCGIHPLYIPFFGVRPQGDIFVGSRGLKLYPADGTLTFLGGSVALSYLLFRDFQKERVYEFPRDTGFYFEVFTPTQYGALMKKDIASSIFNQLFIRLKEQKYFVPVGIATPVYQIWKVVPDSIQD